MPAPADKLAEYKRLAKIAEYQRLGASETSPLVDEAVLARPSQQPGVGPRRSRPAAPITVTAPAPSPVAKRLATALGTATKKAFPYDEELTDDQQQQVARASSARNIAEGVGEVAVDVGKAVGGQAGRTVFRTSAGAARLLGRTKEADNLGALAKWYEEQTAPTTGTGTAARVVSEMSAMIPSGIAGSAVRTGVESAAGKDLSLANMLSQKLAGQEIDNPYLRAGADAALDLALPVALRKSGDLFRGVRQSLDLSGLGDAMQAGMREGAEEGVGNLRSQFRTDGYTPRPQPETNPARLLSNRPAPEGSLQGPAIPMPAGIPRADGPVSSTQRLLPASTARTPQFGPLTGPGIPMPPGTVYPNGPTTPILRLLTAQSTAGTADPRFRMPPISEPVAAPTAPVVRGPSRRASPQSVVDAAIRAAEEARAAKALAADQATAATEKEVAAYVRKRTPIEEALARAAATVETRAIRSINAREAVGDVRGAAAKAGRIAPGAENAPTLTPTPDAVLAREAERVAGEVQPPRGGEPPSGFNTTRPIDKALDDFDAKPDATYPDGSARLTDEEWANAPQLLAAETMPKSRAKQTDRQLALEQAAREQTVGELSARIAAFEEATSGAMESASTGAASLASRAPKRSRVTGELLTTKKEMQSRYGNLTEEQIGALEEAGLGDAQAFLARRKQINVDRLTLKANERALQAVTAEQAKRAGAAGAPAAATTKRPRKGFIDPTAAGGVGGFGAGFTAGLATDKPDDNLTPLQRALAYGMAGAGVGAGAMAGMKVATRSARVAPLIPELAPVTATINVGERVKSSPVGTRWERVKSGAQTAYTRLVSENYPLEKAAERFGAGATGRQSMEIAIRRQQAAGGMTKEYLERTFTPLIKGKSEEFKESVRGLLKARRDWQIRQKGGGAKSVVPNDVLERAVQAGNANAEVAQTADAITAAHRELLEMRYHAGLLTDEAYEAIKASDDFYTPLIKDLEDAGRVGTLSGAKTGKMSVFNSGVKKMDREADQLANTADPLEMLVADAARTFRDVGKQRVANILYDVVDGTGIPGVRRIQANPMNPPTRDGVVKQVRNGKTYFYEFDDKDLYNAMAGQGRQSANWAMRLGQALKNIKTAGIVALPDFAVANVIRDVAMSGIQRPDVRRAMGEAATGALAGGAGNAYQNRDNELGPVKNFLAGAGLGAGAGLYARPLLQSMSAVKSIIKNDDLFREFLRAGGSTEGFFVKDAADAAKMVKALEEGPGFHRSDILDPRNWWSTLQKIGSVGEQSTRLAAYTQMRDFTGSQALGAMAAQDRTLRFANRGSDKFVQGAASVTPFFNAKIQGWDKLGRMLADPKTYGLGAAMLTAPSLALWSVNKDIPEYWERPLYERNLFWLVPKEMLNGGDVPKPGESRFYRIPKPFELGYLFASLPERAMDYVTQRGGTVLGFDAPDSASPAVADPKRGIKRAAADMAMSTIDGTLPIPAGISTALQLGLDKDLFRNRPIVSRPSLSPELQITPESSAIARALAKIGISPEKTDFAIRDVFGQAGSEASKLVDAGARTVGLSSSVPQPGARQMPLVGRFADRFETSNRGQSDFEASAREEIRSLKQIEADLRELERVNDRPALLAFVRKNAAALQRAEAIQPLESELDELSSLRNEVAKDPTLTQEQKRKVLDLIRSKAAKKAAEILGKPIIPTP